MNRFVGLLIAIILLAAPLSAFASRKFSDKDGQRIEFGSFFGVDLWGTQVKPINAHGILYLPDGASSKNKVPLAILISGIGGQRGRDNRMCDMLAENGIVCFGVRTDASRGIKHDAKWSAKFKIAGAGSRLHDAYGALEHLKTHEAVDPKRIWHIGFSLGGFNSAMGLDSVMTSTFQLSEDDFVGFINLYGFCALTTTAKLKNVSYHGFIGSGDGNYHKEECEAFINSIKERGVDASFTVFEGSQFKKIGHAWDSMSAISGGWHGKPEGPWKLNRDGKSTGSQGIGLHECDFKVDPSQKSLNAASDSISTPNDVEGWDFALKNCPKRKGVTTYNHKVMKQVDSAIVDIILGR